MTIFEPHGKRKTQYVLSDSTLFSDHFSSGGLRRVIPLPCVKQGCQHRLRICAREDWGGGGAPSLPYMEMKEKTTARWP